MDKEAQRQKALCKEQCKIRVLAVAKMLNGGQLMTSNDILRRLELQYDIKAERKTIYDDIVAINRFVPIEVTGGRGGGYRKCVVETEETNEDKNQSPCDTCTRVEDPINCERKCCKPWQEWWMQRWDEVRNVEL